MNKKLVNIIIVCLIFITVSMVYYYAIRPIRKDWKYSICLERAWSDGRIYNRYSDVWKATENTEYWVNMCIKQYK